MSRVNSAPTSSRACFASLSASALLRPCLRASCRAALAAFCDFSACPCARSANPCCSWRTDSLTNVPGPMTTFAAFASAIRPHGLTDPPVGIVPRGTLPEMHPSRPMTFCRLSVSRIRLSSPRTSTMTLSSPNRSASSSVACAVAVSLPTNVSLLASGCRRSDSPAPISVRAMHTASTSRGRPAANAASACSGRLTVPSEPRRRSTSAGSAGSRSDPCRWCRTSAGRCRVARGRHRAGRPSHEWCRAGAGRQARAG